MSEQNDNNQRPGAGVDIFGAQPSARQDGFTSSAAATQQAGHADTAPARRRPSLGPVHFGIGAAVLAAAWIGWPYISRASSGDPQANSSRMLVPSQDLPARPVAKGVAPANVSAGSAPAAAATPTAVVMPTAAVVPAAGAMSPAVASNTSSASPGAPTTTELQARIDELQARLAQPGTCNAPASTKPKARRAIRGGRHVASLVHAERRDSVPIVPNFTLNTIYRGQAWIQSTERTYVVQPGDVVDGLRVVRVDPRAHQVVTSRGLIR